MLPGSAIPKEDWLDKIWFDKWVHAGMFFILVYLWSGAMRKTKKTGIKTAFSAVAAAACIYGAGMEWVQKLFIANRSFDPGDIVADIAGSGLALLYVLGRYKKNKPL